MKAIYATIYFLLSVFGGKAFANRQFRLRKLLKHFFFQKILMINRHVPWPVHPTTKVKGVKNIQRGDRNPGMSVGCYLDGRNGIKFGSNNWVGPGVTIISTNHDLQDYSRYKDAPPVQFGDNCWIAANAIILPGVQLGNHVVVAAGAIVTKSFPESDIVLAGNPAKIVKQLSPYGETSA